MKQAILAIILIIIGSIIIAIPATKYNWKTRTVIILGSIWGMMSYYIAKTIIL